MREGARVQEGKSRGFEEGVRWGIRGQNKGLEVHGPRKWGVRPVPVQNPGRKVTGGVRRSRGFEEEGSVGLGKRRGGSRRGTHRTHDTHDALPQQP